MRLLTISIIFVFVLSSFASAGWVDDFYKAKHDTFMNKVQNQDPVKEQTKTMNQSRLNECKRISIYNNEIERLNNEPVIQEILSTFEEGYYVLELKGDPYRDTNYITGYVDNQQLKWVKLGNCAGTESYTKYETNVNLEHVEERVQAAYKYNEDGQLIEDRSEILKIGYATLRDIKGVSITQKFHIIMATTKFSLRGYDN